MKRKTFKKWLMSIGGISRNDADYISEMVVRRGKSYGVVHSKIVADPWLSEMLDIILNAEPPKEE